MATHPSDRFTVNGTISCLSERIYENGKRDKKLLYSMCMGLYSEDTGAGRVRRLGDFSIPPFVSVSGKRLFEPSSSDLAKEVIRREKLLHLPNEPRPNFDQKSSLLDWLGRNPIIHVGDIQFLRREEKKFFDYLSGYLPFLPIPPSTVNDDDNNNKNKNNDDDDDDNNNSNKNNDDENNCNNVRRRRNTHGRMNGVAREVAEAIVGQPVPILPTTTDRSIADDEHIDDVDDDKEEDVAVDEDNGDAVTPSFPTAETTANGQTSVDDDTTTGYDTPAEPSDSEGETPRDVNTVENDIGESEETSNVTSPTRKRMRVEQQHFREGGGDSAAAVPFIPPIQDVEIEGQHHPNENILVTLQQMSSALNQSVSLLRNVMIPFLPPTPGSPGSPELELATAAAAAASTVAVATVAPPPLPQGMTSPSDVLWMEDHEVARREAAFDIVHKRERIFLDLLQETSKISNTTIKAIFEQRVIVAQENLNEAETMYRQLVKQQQQ